MRRFDWKFRREIGADDFLCSIEGAGAGAGGAGAGAGAGAAGPGAGAPGAGAGDPWYQPYVGKVKPETLSWLDGKKFGDPVAALDSAALADKMARDRNVISRPDPAKLGEWDGWSALGFEPDRAKYGAAVKPPKMPNNGKVDQELMDGFVNLAHGAKLPPAIAEGLYHGLTDIVNKRLEGVSAAGAKATQDLETALRGDWGLDYEKNSEVARRAARTLGIGAEDLSEIEKITGSPRLLKLMHKLGTTALEGRLLDNNSGGAPGAMTPAAAEAELRRLEADPNWLKGFTNQSHPQHEDFKAQHLRLVDIIAKGRKAA